MLWLAVPLLGDDDKQQPDAILLQQLPFSDDTRMAEMPSFDRRVPTHQKKVQATTTANNLCLGLVSQSVGQCLATKNSW